MAERYSYEQIKASMLEHKKILLSDDDDVLALRQHIYALRKDGFVVKRIGEIGDIEGYELVEKPNDKQ